jgi:hypothetical protein
MTVDWWQVFFHFIWIAGLSLLLAATSYAHYEARLKEESLTTILSLPNFDLATAVGLALFFGGLALVDQRWWARGIWLILVLAVGVIFWRHRHSAVH